MNFFRKLFWTSHSIYPGILQNFFSYSSRNSRKESPAFFSKIFISYSYRDSYAFLRFPPGFPSTQQIFLGIIWNDHQVSIKVIVLSHFLPELSPAISFNVSTENFFKKFRHLESNLLKILEMNSRKIQRR